VLDESVADFGPQVPHERDCLENGNVLLEAPPVNVESCGRFHGRNLANGFEVEIFSSVGMLGRRIEVSIRTDLHTCSTIYE
jgi:hypothetical protein